MPFFGLSLSFIPCRLNQELSSSFLLADGVSIPVGSSPSNETSNFVSESLLFRWKNAWKGVILAYSPARTKAPFPSFPAEL